MAFRNSVPGKARGMAVFLRTRRTNAQHELWQFLRRGLLGVKFRRCGLVRGHVVDFWCPKKLLVVQVDGPRRDMAAERIRESDMQGWGIRVLRFPDDLVRTDKLGVLAEILAALSAP